jgi:large subunit ribosomal protein L17
MRHNVAHRKLGRVTEHRLALLRNQAIALLRHEKIETTMPKAKELRPFVERLITIARRGVAAGDAAGKTLHARRMVLAELPDTEVVRKLFETLAPRFAERPGGYTRILRVGYRRGDSAEVAHVELVGSEYNPTAKVEKDDEGGEDTPKKAKGRRRAHQARRAAHARRHGRRWSQGAGRWSDQGRRTQVHHSSKGGGLLTFLTPLPLPPVPVPPSTRR